MRYSDVLQTLVIIGNTHLSEDSLRITFCRKNCGQLFRGSLSELRDCRSLRFVFKVIKLILSIAATAIHVRTNTLQTYSIYLTREIHVVYKLQIIISLPMCEKSCRFDVTFLIWEYNPDCYRGSPDRHIC